jgi:hypothetical protein
MSGQLFTPAQGPLALPDVLMRSEAHEAFKITALAFRSVYGESTTISADLDLAGRFFDPVATGQRLRREIEALDVDEDVRLESLPEIWFLRVPVNKALLTPEGIAAMHALSSALKDNPASAIETRAYAEAATAALLARYRAWGHHRIRGVVGLLEGTDKPLQVQGAGILLALLVNGNVGEESALSRAGIGAVDKRDAIDRAFDAGVQAFTESLAPNSKRKSGSERLISGWKLGEVARRLGGGLVVKQSSDRSHDAVFVRPDRRDAALKLIARDLARGNRTIPSTAELGHAFDELVSAFLKERMTLASFGELHENARDTERLRAELLSQYEVGDGAE